MARKVWMLLVAPLVAVLLASAPAAWSASTAVGQAGQLHATAALDTASSVLATQLHVVRVRLAAASLAGADAASRGVVLAALDRAAALRAEFDAAGSAVSAPSAALRRAMPEALRALDAVDQAALQVRANAPMALSPTLLLFREAIVDLIAVRDASAQSSPDPVLADAMHAAAALSRAREAVGREQLVVLQAVAAGRMSAVSAQAVITARADAATALEDFGRLGRPQWRERLADAQDDPGVEAATRLSGVVPLSAGPLPVLPGGAAGWNAAMQGWADRLGQLEAGVDADIAAAADAMRAQASWSVVVVGGGVLLAVLAALGLTVVVARSLTGRLQRLQAAARRVADQELPTLISRIITAEDRDKAARLAAEALRASAMPHTDRDEIGVLAQVVDRLVRAAAYAAVSQVDYRLVMLALVHTIGGRVDSGTKRMFKVLDQIEGQETDPARLDSFFELDLAVAEQSRFAMNLAVLAGGAPMTQAGPAPLAEVVGGAVSKVRDYRRVDVGQLPLVRVTPGAVLAVLHIVVELLDNAARYSMPDTRVRVAAEMTDGHVRVSVDDLGLEVSDARLGELNATLLRPPVDVGNAGRIGLLVVARLARTHGIGVALNRNEDRGLTAVVDLPPAILLPAGPDRYPAITKVPQPAASVSAGPAGTAAAWDFQPAPRPALTAVAGRVASGEPAVLSTAARSGGPPPTGVAAEGPAPPPRFAASAGGWG
ncbi:sensor histidine kinase [Dactylosporangium salmoneum]|uniref:histidine kinase n=1 Tax=Dactylosporangium salmoneum TaxID=53361 RepID=A0ABN3GHP8_9ACTN